MVLSDVISTANVTPSTQQPLSKSQVRNSKRQEPRQSPFARFRRDRVDINEKVQAARGEDTSSQSLANVRPTGTRGSFGTSLLWVAFATAGHPSGAGRGVCHSINPPDEPKLHSRPFGCRPNSPSRSKTPIFSLLTGLIERVGVSLGVGRITNTGPAW